MQSTQVQVSASSRNPLRSGPSFSSVSTPLHIQFSDEKVRTSRRAFLDMAFI